ncbi:hypothetical protein NP233_g8987 [Leucocoprinus birnbaumii]|uniref:Argonaute-like protein n=1 Tax=Leucocoprinus birnbaumii TaxID=56174 RepID=A0AAD5VNQ7_9AGAR|nr:hypothetical protein NP233_g8987 [Leucocoprinus birnbaumii]
MSAARGRGRGSDRGRGGFPDRGRGGFERGRGRGGGQSPASSDSGFRGRGGDRGRGRGGSRGPPPGIYSPPGRATQIDGRLRDKTQDELIQAFKSVKIDDTDFPLRPGYGESGRQVALRTNFFSVSIPKGPFYEYKVNITPAASVRRVRRRIFELAEDTAIWQTTLAGSVAHDHSAKLVARQRLPEPLTVRVAFYDEDEDPPAPGTPPKKEYTLTFEFIQELETESLKSFIDGDPQYRDYDIMPIVSAFNLILAAYPSRSGGGGVMVGRNKFFLPGARPAFSLGGGLEAVKGFYSSVRTAHKQLMVNVNVCTTAFYKPGNLADALNEFMRMSFSARANAFVKGLRVKALHLGYRKTITKVTDYTANTYIFDSGEFGEVSVAEYFLKKYKLKLRYPNLPLMDVGGQRTNFLPAELCEILPNQPFRGKLLEEHTAAMITVAANPPNANADAIENQGLRELGFAQNTPTLAAFGVGVGREMATVPGRILPPPKPKYRQNVDGGDFKADKASWNLRKVKFTKGAVLENWAVLVIRDNNRDDFSGPVDPHLKEILSGFSNMCGVSGMTVKSQPKVADVALPPKNRSRDPTRSQAIKAIQTAMGTSFKPKPKIILIILSDSDRHIYAGIKRLCDVALDVATVCVQSGKIRGGGPQYYANVALKINMKLGGVNHTLDPTSLSWLKEKPTMLVGMDVTHPGPGSVRGTPSIAAVVASYDSDYAQFPASMKMQESKKEMITDLEDMMYERLKVFQARNKGRLPDRVLVYRDGVSEGQFQIVIDQEMPPMLKAFHRIDVKHRPKLTIVVCGKRHHTRFFPTQEGDADSKANPLPGTVVDRGITSVYNFDFYLQAHGSLQGSSKPTHYFVIHDEIGFTQDKLQSLTNSVSYMFARATKAVSLVSPAYYADLALSHVYSSKSARSWSPWSDHGSRRGNKGSGGRGPAPGVYSPPGRATQIDARLLDDTQDKVVEAFRNTQVDDTDFPLRPGYGEKGKQVTLRTNFFPISIPEGPFYEYKITITPSISIKSVKRRIFELAQDMSVWRSTLADSVAHDYSAKLVARRRLPEPLVVCVPFYEKGENPPTAETPLKMEYSLSFQFVQDIETDGLKRFIAGDPQYRNYDIMPVISALNLILAAYPSRSGGGGVTVGRNKFFMPGAGPTSSLGGGLEAVRGFYSSVRAAHRQLMVNVNVCTTAFYKPGNLAEALIDIRKSDFKFARLGAFAKGLRVRVTHLNHQKTITEVAKDSATSYIFSSDEYGEVSVAKFFLKKYNIELKYPDLPLVNIGVKKRTLLPPEVCEVLLNQTYKGRLSEGHTAKMISFAANPPDFNARTIENKGLQELGFMQNESNRAAFGVNIGKEMATVPGRILAPPKPKYRQGTDGGDFKDKKASWNLRGVKFASGAILDNWAVLLIRDSSRSHDFEGSNDPELQRILKSFMETCNKSGMDIRTWAKIVEVDLVQTTRADPAMSPAINQIRTVVDELVQEAKPKLIMVFLSDGDQHIYSGLKHLCDTINDVATVCVQSGKIWKAGPQYHANVALKLNMKLGGVNHTLDPGSLEWLKEKPTMLVGIDVTHPGATSVKGTPSIAAVVASCELDYYAHFPASLRMQKSKKEMVTDLEEMMVERLQVFQGKNKDTLPERVIVYRDGVSEGQFGTVIEEEMPLIISAFRRMHSDYQPKLTNHHLHEKANPLPGTVVDRGITTVYHFDFYLQAHGSLQGSSKPTHYFVIHDEIGFSQDMIQSLTNNISYMFARATRAVSLVAPAYYADLACERGRCYLHELLHGIRSGGRDARSGDEQQILREAREFWKEGPTGDDIRDTMFYL